MLPVSATTSSTVPPSPTIQETEKDYAGALEIARYPQLEGTACLWWQILLGFGMCFFLILGWMGWSRIKAKFRWKSSQIFDFRPMPLLAILVTKSRPMTTKGSTLFHGQVTRPNCLASSSASWRPARSRFLARLLGLGLRPVWKTLPSGNQTWQWEIPCKWMF